MASKLVTDLGPAVSNAALEAFRAGRPRAFRTMVELCSCAMAECRAFQALVHNGTIRTEVDYEEYISPPYACRRDDCEGLFEELVHQALEREAGAESVACDLGVDSMESGFSVTMETVSGGLLLLEVAIDEHDTDEGLMQRACETATGIGYRKGENPAGGDFCFLSCRCTVTAKGEGGSDDEEEAQTTDDEEDDDDDDDDDEDFVPSDESDTGGGRPVKRRRGAWAK